MLDFSDLPYAYFEPEYSPMWATILRVHNRRWQLPHKHKISEVVTIGGEVLEKAKRHGEHVILVPNHPTHSDAAIMAEAVNRHGGKIKLRKLADKMTKARGGKNVNRLSEVSV